MPTTLDRQAVRQRAARPFATEPHPFLKWAGSKRLLLGQLVDALPAQFGRYYEPFLGGGSLFFLLCPKSAVLGDNCLELIETYRAVRDNVAAVIRFLQPLIPSERLFYRLRARRSNGRFKRAAEFIYLNKTCWNGLYRVNSSGLFNVPYGAPKTDSTFDPENLRRCAKALRSRSVHLQHSDFDDLVEDARCNDLVFLDPPYVTGHTDNGFIDYNEVLFSWADQERLAATAAALRRKGVHVIVSNADHPQVRRLYRSFRAVTFTRRSTLASDAVKRKMVTEALYLAV